MMISSSLWLKKLGALTSLIAGALVILGTSPDDIPSRQRIFEKELAVGQSELHFRVRTSPAYYITVGVSSDVELVWLNGPIDLPDSARNPNVSSSEIRLYCTDLCGAVPCADYCEGLSIAVIREDTSKTQSFTITVSVGAAGHDDITVIELLPE